MAGLRKIFLRLSLVVASLLLAMVAALYALFGLEAGRIALVTRLLATVASPNLTIQTQGWHSQGLGDWHLEQLRLLRQGQLWIEVHQLHLAWSPRELRQHRLHILELSAETLDWHPVPRGPSASEDWAWQSLPPIKLDRLQVGRWRWLDFAAPAPDYQLNANGTWAWDQQPLVINAEVRTPGAAAPVLSLSTQTLGDNHWQLAGQLQEAAGGFFGQALLVPPRQALDARFALHLVGSQTGYSLQLQQLKFPWDGHSVSATGDAWAASDFSRFHFNLTHLDIDQAPQRLRGEIAEHQVWLDMQLQNFPLALLSPWLDVPPGTASGELSLTTPTHRALAPDGHRIWPQLQAKGQVNTQWHDLSLQLNVDGELQDHLARFRRLEVDWAAAHLSAQGQWHFGGDQTDFEFRVHQFDSQLLRRMAIPFLQRDQNRVARVINRSDLLVTEAQGHFSGAWQDPQVRLKASAQGRYMSTPLSLVVDTDLNLRQAQARLLALQLPGDAALRVQGRVDWTGASSNITSQFTAINQNHLALVGVLLPDGLYSHISGSANITGALPQPKVVLDATATGYYQTLRRQLPFDLLAKGEVTWGRRGPLRFSAAPLALSLDGQPVAALNGTYASEQLALALQIQQLPTDALRALGLPALPGKAQGNVQLTGSFAQPQLTGQLAYAYSLKRRDGGFTPLTWRAHMATQGRELQVQSEFAEEGHSLGQLNAQLPLDDYWKSRLLDEADVPLSVKLQANGDLSLAKFFLDPSLYPLHGHLGLDLTASGSLETPQLSGRIQIQDGQFEQRLLGTRLTNLYLDAHADGQLLVIDQATAKDGAQGSAQLRGQINWQNPLATDAVQLNLGLSQFHGLERRDISASATGQLKLLGNLDALQLSGDLEIAPLNLSVESAVSSRIPQIQVTEYNSLMAQSPALGGDPLWPSLAVDLSLHTQNQAFLRGRGLESELQGSMRISGPSDQLRYSGTLTSPRGRFDLFGKRFVLERGEVSFDQDAINLFIPATYKKADLEVRAQLTGSIKDPKLSLSSIPELPQDEILARLIFGKQVQSMTPFEALRLATTVQSLSQGGFDPVGSARDLLGVDSLSIDTEATKDGQTGVNLGVGKYVGERVYLEVQRSPNPTTPWQGDVQIELTPSISLESSTGENGRGKAQLLWRRDY